MRCHATVRQVGDTFARGPQAHCHPGDLRLPLKISVSSRLDLDFLKADEFLVSDIQEDGQRHLVHSTPFQLRILRHAKRWFIDGTFKIVGDPFTQLASVHAFVQIDGVRKQFPLAFAVMSRRQKADYVKLPGSRLARFFQMSRPRREAYSIGLWPLLRREAELVHANVAAEDLQRDERAGSSRLDARLQEAWSQYIENAISTTSFLRRCGHLYRPSSDTAIAAPPQ